MLSITTLVYFILQPGSSTCNSRGVQGVGVHSKYVLPCQVYAVLGIQPRALYMLNKHSRDFEFLFILCGFTCHGRSEDSLWESILSFPLQIWGSNSGCQALTGQAPLSTEPLPAPSRTFYLLLFNMCVCMPHLYWGQQKKRL